MEDNIQNEGLFDDFVAEDMPIDSEESEETTPVETEQESTPATQEPFLNIKYDKEEIGLTREEAKELAEKGKNYERLYDKYSSLNEPLERLARLNNMDVNTFINELNNSQYNLEVNREMQLLRDNYPTAEDEVLRELATKRVEEKITLSEQRVQEEAQRNATAQKNEVLRQLDLFRGEYPDLEPDKLDPQVYEFVKSGYTLLEAYNKWARGIGSKNQAARDKKAQIDSLNETNKNKSLGNTSNVEGVDVDAFLSGFLD